MRFPKRRRDARKISSVDLPLPPSLSLSASTSLSSLKPTTSPGPVTQHDQASVQHVDERIVIENRISSNPARGTSSPQLRVIIIERRRRRVTGSPYVRVHNGKRKRGRRNGNTRSNMEMDITELREETLCSDETEEEEEEEKK